MKLFGMDVVENAAVPRGTIFVGDKREFERLQRAAEADILDQLRATGLFNEVDILSGNALNPSPYSDNSPKLSVWGDKRNDEGVRSVTAEEIVDDFYVSSRAHSLRETLLQEHARILGRTEFVHDPRFANLPKAPDIDVFCEPQGYPIYTVEMPDDAGLRQIEDGAVQG